MWSEYIDVMGENEEVFLIVGDLMTRGHYWPDGVMALRETAPRPPSPTEKFLPGQRVAFLLNGAQMEHEITDAVEWDQAEARIVEKPLRNAKADTYEWRLSELTAGTIRVTVTLSGNYGALEKLGRGKSFRTFYVETLKRLKEYIEDKRSFAGPRTFAPKATTNPNDPLANL